MRYTLVGGNPFRMYTGTTTFTSISVVGQTNTIKEMQQLVNDSYEKCGGLLLVLDNETGREVVYTEDSKLAE